MLIRIDDLLTPSYLLTPVKVLLAHDDVNHEQQKVCVGGGGGRKETFSDPHEESLYPAL